MPAQLTELKVQDVAIKLHRAGRGPSVLFLHGAGGVPQWLPFFDVLAERYELLVPEHPGFGTTAEPVSGSRARNQLRIPGRRRAKGTSRRARPSRRPR